MSLEDKKLFEINLNVEELNTVLGALGELPAKASMGVIMNIQQQAQQQSSQSKLTESVEES
jgi:hypothetical protein